MSDSRSIFEELRVALTKRASVMAHRYRGVPGFPDPEDLAQQVIVNLIDHYGERSLDAFGRARTFGLAYRTLHNLVVDSIRAKHVEYLSSHGDEEGLMPEAVDQREDPCSAVEQTQVLTVLRRHLKKTLGLDERRFLLLSFELDSAPEAHKRCGWPPGDHSPSSLCHLRRRLLGRVMRDFPLTAG